MLLLDKALQEMEKTLELDPNNKTIFSNMILVIVITSLVKMHK
jgi:Flp pilus assembly protein TadD